MAQLKPLHKAKNIEALEPLYQLPKDIRTKKVMTLCGSARNLKQHADGYYLARDEEEAYIAYMKYLNLMDTIKKHREYGDHKRNVMEALGPNREIIIVYDKLERLKKSLEQRYASIGVHNEREQNKARNLQDHISPIISHVKYSIDAKELFEMITNSRLSMLIMDCRSEQDFASSRIKYEYQVNVPDAWLVAGMTAGRIHADLSPEYKTLWTSRKVKEQIVLMDNESQGAPPKDSPIRVLEDILKNWDPDAVYKKPFLKVDGGFKSFVLHYPMYCTNSNYIVTTMDTRYNLSVDDIEYPDINDIRMKEDSFGSQPGRPVVDRNSKAAALHIYESKSKGEILEEQEKLVDRSIQNEMDMLSAESELKKIHAVEATVADDEEKKKMRQKITELKYKIMQYENSRDDNAIRIAALEDKIRKYEEEEGERISNQQAAALEEQARERILQKQEAQKKLDLELARLAQERQELERKAKLQQAYENKRSLKENQEQKERQIPAFDRAAKPTNALSDYNHNVQREVQRDFSPVVGRVERGLTGLKNLGNTCYMNSILQCLSNTTFLRDYFQSGAFIQKLNRKNKTQGRIAEEVAAVIKELWTGQYKCIASKNLRFVVGHYERQFGGIEQQDSHEFLTILMDWLHSDLQTVDIKPDIENLSASEKAWVEYFKGKESYISGLSYGQIKSTVKCTSCGKESATYECFSSLSLELPLDTNRCELNDCLEMYFDGERIRGWNCPQCKSNQDAIKKLDISRLPSVLIIHFKRFYADPDAISTVYKKKQNYVKFPLTDLDMSPHVAPSEKFRNQKLIDRRFQLYGVSNHYGTMESGHYTAFCRNMSLKKWFKFDDHAVSSIDGSDVRSSAAYILFYSVLSEPGMQIR